MTTETIERAAAWLAAARCVVASTGAGMSAESGVPTFRDEAGLWKNFNVDDYATPQAFARDPQKVWAWYRWRRSNLANVQPHAGHAVIADWVRGHAGFHLITQNVDGLHERAGVPSAIELHGRLDVARCTACPARVKGLSDLGEDPRCTQCGARLRPGVVWFGESLPADALQRAFELARSCELMMVIGTSGTVQPAASLATVAKNAGARLIEINPGHTPISNFADLHFQSGCRDTLVAIDEACRRHAPAMGR